MSTDNGSRPIVAREARTGLEHRYQTDRELGEGASGQVFLARRLPSDDERFADDARKVALKVVYAPKWKGYLAEEAKHLLRLQKAADERALLERNFVNRLVRIGLEGAVLEDRDRGASIIELEYLDGVTLAQWYENEWRRRTSLSPADILDEVLRVAQELGEALSQLAGEVMVHRDIKPENIMRTSQGLRLFDFNIARPVDEDMTRHIGTQGYMAPEVIDGKYNQRADLYSVGVILWQIVHRRQLEPHLAFRKEGTRLSLIWPTEELRRLPGATSGPIQTLLDGLLVEEDRRLEDAAALLRVVEALRAPLLREGRAVDQLGALDMIGLLSELRPSGLASVVTDARDRVPDQELQDFLRARMQVDDPLEDWLEREVATAATASRPRRTLFLLAGNAGDGKSHLLRLLRDRWRDRPEILRQVHFIADATHALSPRATQHARLEQFFAPFADATPSDDERVHLIAMNTGIAIRFFEGPGARERFATLYRELQRQLGLRRPDSTEKPLPFRVEVINLDLRNLVASATGSRSFFERMLDRLDPEMAGSIPQPKWDYCRSKCPAFSQCPVAFNLQALRMDAPRRATLRILERAALDNEVHLSPRNLWALIYWIVTGGVDRYRVEGRDQNEGACDVVRAQVQGGHADWLMEGHFTELLFAPSGAGAPSVALARLDPAFSSVPELDRLHTRLSIKTELDNDAQVVEAELGGQGSSLAGLALDKLTAGLSSDATRRHVRRDAAVRRQVLFHPETFAAWWRQEGGGHFLSLLTAYNAFSAAPQQLSSTEKDELKKLRELVQSVFLHGSGRSVAGADYLRVSQPNRRSSSELLVRAESAALSNLLSVQRIVRPDIHIQAHGGREHILRLLGYHPNHVVLDVLGVRIAVDLPLYEFLVRVNDGQKPARRDLAQFQSLLYMGDRLGNHLAGRQGDKAQELFVWDKTNQKLHRLAVDDFGQTTVTPTS
jgi:serine/threonine protein kinase